MHEGMKKFDLSVFRTIVQNRDKSNIINKPFWYNKGITKSINYPNITKMQKR